jgi:endonuclease-8
MPEGDSIHRLAREIGRAFVGREITAFEGHVFSDETARSLVGRSVIAVDAQGKNLLVRFDDGRLLHVHLRMLGRLRFERPRSAFYAPRRGRPQVRLAVKGAAIVGSRIPVLRLLSEERAKRDLAGLGPDLLRDDWDDVEAMRRLHAEGARAIAEALLLQRVAAGIGNIYKSETLFLEGVDPRAKVSSLSDERLRALLFRASSLLRKNVGPGPRTTRASIAGPKVWVYGRDREPCFRCGTTIVRVRQGFAPGRSTYFCPSCQKP